jgi:hypothetical protein
LKFAGEKNIVRNIKGCAAFAFGAHLFYFVSKWQETTKSSKSESPKSESPIVSIIMGSTSDWETMRNAADVLKISMFRTNAKSFRRTGRPDLLFEFAKTAESRGVEVIIAGAGGAAHLPGMCASQTALCPVLGVPVQSKAFVGNGFAAFNRADALWRSGRNFGDWQRGREKRRAAGCFDSGEFASRTAKETSRI